MVNPPVGVSLFDRRHRFFVPTVFGGAPSAAAIKQRHGQRYHTVSAILDGGEHGVMLAGRSGKRANGGAAPQ
jgi:hypothetical protein